jgi:phosphoribosylformylglycinamidine cyclo-ligase
MGVTLADALLAPHRCYLAEIEQVRAAAIPLHGMAHITGGGFIENIPRVLPSHLAAAIDTAAWQIPQLFQLLLEWSGMQMREALRVFNMGIGMVLVVPADAATDLRRIVPEALLIGHLEMRRDEPVCLS